MVKKVQISSDDITYYTLPGNSGELRNEAGELTDTIFGQEYMSSEVGLISSTLNANALFKGFAGYVCTIKKGGTPTTMTAEAMSLVSGKTYIITNTAKQLIDIDTAITVYDNAVDHNADVESINFLTGEVTFKTAYTPTTPITITGKYIPLAAIGGTRSFTLTQTAEAVDNSDMPTVQGNGGFRTYQAGLKTVSIEFGNVHKLSNAFRAALVSRSKIYVEICPDASSLAVARGLFKYTAEGQSGDVGALEEETLSLKLSVPQDPATAIPWAYPFYWKISNLSTLATAVQKCITAWQTGASLYVKYLYDGTNGIKSSAIVTDISLAGGLEAMSEYTANFQLSGAPTVLP